MLWRPCADGLPNNRLQLTSGAPRLRALVRPPLAAQPGVRKTRGETSEMGGRRRNAPRAWVLHCMLAGVIVAGAGLGSHCWAEWTAETQARRARQALPVGAPCGEIVAAAERYANHGSVVEAQGICSTGASRTVTLQVSRWTSLTYTIAVEVGADGRIAGCPISARGRVRTSDVSVGVSDARGESAVEQPDGADKRPRGRGGTSGSWSSRRARPRQGSRPLRGAFGALDPTCARRRVVGFESPAGASS